MLDRYVAQVRLLLSTLQDVANETVFALKGGTAINLFYRDIPSRTGPSWSAKGAVNSSTVR